jgi:hypothetical protein
MDWPGLIVALVFGAGFLFLVTMGIFAIGLLVRILFSAATDKSQEVLSNHVRPEIDRLKRSRELRARERDISLMEREHELERRAEELNRSKR